MKGAVYIIPRAKAICSDDGETQRVSAPLPTLFRNPTMPAIAGQRCWQNLCHRPCYGGCRGM